MDLRRKLFFQRNGNVRTFDFLFSSRKNCHGKAVETVIFHTSLEFDFSAGPAHFPGSVDAVGTDFCKLESRFFDRLAIDVKRDGSGKDIGSISG